MTQELQTASNSEPRAIKKGDNHAPLTRIAPSRADRAPRVTPGRTSRAAAGAEHRPRQRPFAPAGGHAAYGWAG